MRFIKLYVSLLACIVISNCYARENKYDLSAPTDLSETGVNKVLCMKNGNTMLFHFEPARKINVIVFDSLHKEIANTKEPCKVLDILTLEHVVFKGIYDINGEAVMFFDQDHNGKHELVRLRYNAKNGMLIEEKLIAESQSEDKRMQFFVMKNKDNDNYSILFCTDKRHPKECDIFIVFFDAHHKSIREIQLPVDRKKFDYLRVIDAESQPNGTLISLALAKTTVNGLTTDMEPDTHMSAVYDHFMQYFYIPKDSSSAKTGIVSLSTGVFAQYAAYTYNHFASALNLLVYSYKPIDTRFGTHEVTGGMSRDLFFRFNEDDFSIGLNDIKNTMANDFYKQNAGVDKNFIGVPLTMFTNENGLTTLISETHTTYGVAETRVRYNYEDYFGTIAVTQVDDNGNELWGAVLPLSQYYKSYQHYLDVNAIAKRWQNQPLFEDMPSQVYNRQFIGINAYCREKNYYIVYNDYNKNFGNSLKNPGDTVYSFNTTNTCYYKMNRKKEITKHHLFGEPITDEYKCSFIEGADFDESRGIYASLVQYKKGDEISLRMAWSHLD